MVRPVRESLYGVRPRPFITIPVVVMLAILLTSLGYYILGVIEHQPWSFFDCIYMTVISFTTVGYGEVLPGMDRVPHARAYTSVILVIGYGIVVWAFSSITASFVESRFSEIMARRRMMAAIDQLSGHYIVCGLGETGRHVVEEMVRTKRDVVVVERDRERLAAMLAERAVHFIEGDAEDEATLRAAGITRAAGLVACLPEDKDNIYIVLSARQLNPELRIVARGVQTDSREKLIRAGADVVVAPNYIGGLRIASEMIRPHVTTFLDVMLRDQDHAIRVEEVTIPAGSHLVGRKLGEANIHRECGLLVLATQREDETGYVSGYSYNPGPDTVLEAGMTLIVLGDAADAKRLRDMVQR